MSSLINPTVWEDRWQALDQLLLHLRDHDLPGPTFRTLVACLQTFAESQFRFFYDGLQAGRLWPSAQYPADYVLRATLDQVAYDLAAIQQAAQ